MGGGVRFDLLRIGFQFVARERFSTVFNQVNQMKSTCDGGMFSRRKRAIYYAPLTT